MADRPKTIDINDINIISLQAAEVKQKAGIFPLYSLVKDINEWSTGREMAINEKRTKAGRTVTVQQYRKAGNHKGKRAKKGTGTTPAQKEGNFRRAVMMLTWLMNANYQDGDLLVTLDYKREYRPQDSAQMNRDFNNFFARLKRAMAKSGLAPPKYIRVLEVGKRGARHHHLLLPGTVSLPVLQKCWAAGGVNVKPLFTDGNYRAIAEYFVKYSRTTMETEAREMKKLWYPSKGLKKPVPGKPKEIKSRELGQIKVPKGYYLDQDSVKAGISTFDGYETFSYILIRMPDKWKGGSRHGGKTSDQHLHRGDEPRAADT